MNLRQILLTGINLFAVSLAFATDAHVRKVQNMQDFNNQINGPKPAVVKFYAEWCPPCKRLTPVFHAISNELNDRVTFIEINSDTHPDIASKYSVQSLPTLIYIKNGKKVGSTIGFQTNKELRKSITQFLGI